MKTGFNTGSYWPNRMTATGQRIISNSVVQLIVVTTTNGVADSIRGIEQDTGRL